MFETYKQSLKIFKENVVFEYNISYDVKQQFKKMYVILLCINLMFSN